MNTQHEQFDTARLNDIPITEVARRLGDTVRHSGVNHMTLCPWHDDHHPSLSLVEKTGKNFCYCFSCQHSGDVIGFTMQHEGWTFIEACQWLSSTFGICTTQVSHNVPMPKPRPVVEPVQPSYSYIPKEMLDWLVSADNSLCRCLMRMFQPELVKWLVEEYQLGSYAMNGIDDYTVFPSIDVAGRVCNLKIQHYDTDTESLRFAHSDQTAYWLGSMWVKDGLLPADAKFRSDSLFGEHLLMRYPSSFVALVESPKNALFGALAFPRLTWVATGNKGNLKRQSLLPLQGRDVIVVPDCDAVDVWSDKIAEMKDLANFTVSDFCRRMAPEDQPKFDIADFIAQEHAPAF